MRPDFNNKCRGAIRLLMLCVQVCRWNIQGSSRTVRPDVFYPRIRQKGWRAEAVADVLRPYVAATNQRLQASPYGTHTTSTMSSACPGCRL